MAVTDDERREVARRLREYVDLPDDWWQETCAEFYVEKCVFGNVDRHSEAELFARLADLIEPSCDRIEGVLCTMEGAPYPGEALPEIDTCDRDALLALADEIERTADFDTGIDPRVLFSFSRRIREACGEVER